MKKQNKTKEDNQNVVGGSAIAFCFCVSWPFVWVALLQKNNNSIGCAVFFSYWRMRGNNKNNSNNENSCGVVLIFRVFFLNSFLLYERSLGGRPVDENDSKLGRRT